MKIDQPNIQVGIMFANTIEFQLNGEFKDSLGNLIKDFHGTIKREKSGAVTLNGEPTTIPLSFEPVDIQHSDFDLLNVTIGINFHWERNENQKFKGTLKFIDEGSHLTAVNELPLELYLQSVISSEMSANSPEELLKAHAVISRSWLLAQREKQKELNGAKQIRNSEKGERIEWWDREDHLNFDVCADDHCQRYQGISNASTPQVIKALATTHGEVLTFNGKICDARFSKCCGGITELFESAWEEAEHPYLAKVIDSPMGEASPIKIESEEQAKEWIMQGSKDSFCNTTDKNILGTVLNNYDLETPDFYRWRVDYTTEQLSNLIAKRLGYSFGTIKDLIPIERGVSGRLTKLKIVGTERTEVIGKELLIRKALSESHLYSSAFIIEQNKQGFTLHGAGWGHGVGLCQIGAAVMASKGYSYQQILAHYFPGSTLTELY